MPIKKKAKPKTDLAAIKVILNAQLQCNDLEQKIVDLNRLLLIEKNEHNTLRQRLISLLNQSQIEAARIAGCSAEIYALEWIDILRDEQVLSKYAPAFSEQVSNFTNMSGRNI